MAQQGAGGTKS